MKTWIPFEEIEARMMQDADFAEGVRQAGIRLEERRAVECVQALRPALLRLKKRPRAKVAAPQRKRARAVA